MLRSVVSAMLGARRTAVLPPDPAAGAAACQNHLREVTELQVPLGTPGASPALLTGSFCFSFCFFPLRRVGGRGGQPCWGPLPLSASCQRRGLLAVRLSSSSAAPAWPKMVGTNNQAEIGGIQVEGDPAGPRGERGAWWPSVGLGMELGVQTDISAFWGTQPPQTFLPRFREVTQSPETWKTELLRCPTLTSSFWKHLSAF